MKQSLKRWSGLALCLVLMGPVDGWAQSRVGTTAAPFLTIGTGARGQALGHAYTTMAIGGDALFWNPAGAARAHDDRFRSNVFFTNYSWIADIRYDAVGVVLPVTSAGVVGLSVAAVNYGRMDVRTVARPEGTGETFGASDISVGASYAQPLTDFFYLGGTVKYIRQAIRDMSASTFAFDIGFVLETDYLNGLKVAASIMNFGGMLQMEGVNTEIFVDIDPNNSGSNPDIPANLNTDKWDLPLSFKFGIDWPIINTEGLGFDVLAEVHQTNDNDLNGDFGAQFQYRTKTVRLDLRAGYKDLFLDNVASHLSYGVGLDIQISQRMRVAADFAYIPFDFLGSTRLLDLRVHF